MYTTCRMLKFINASYMVYLHALLHPIPPHQTPPHIAISNPPYPKTTHNTPVRYSIDSTQNTTPATRTTAISMFDISSTLWTLISRRLSSLSEGRPRSRSIAVRFCWSYVLGRINKSGMALVSVVVSRATVEWLVVFAVAYCYLELIILWVT